MMIHNIKIIIKKLISYALPLFAIGMLVFTVISVTKKKIEPPREIKFSPPKSIYSNQIGGIGTVEPRTKKINIMPHVDGVISQIFVLENDRIKEGDKLFTVDNRHLIAQRLLAEAKLGTAKVEYEDLKYNYNLFKGLEKTGATSREDVIKKKYAMLKAESKLNEAIAELNIINTKLELLTVHSPITGDVLQVNVSIGEFANTKSITAPLIIGDMRKMRVNVNIDETDINRFNPKAKAYGILRGTDNKKIPLEFIRIQPHIVPKTQITGEPGEKIDTRVMEIIYYFDNTGVNAYPGQQMDVFIEDR